MSDLTTNSLADIVVKATPGPYRFKFNDIFVTDPADGDDMVLACVGKSFGLRSSVYSAPKAHWPEIQAVGELLALAPTLATLVLEMSGHASALISAFDELRAMTVAERIITGRSDRELRKASEEAIAGLRATLAKLESL